MGSIHQENIMTINIHAPAIVGCKYLKQVLIELKGDLGGNAIILGTSKLHSKHWINHPGIKLMTQKPK